MYKKTSPFIKILTYILWVPVILSISFEIITFSDWIYTYNWSRNNISNNTGLSINELNHSSNSIKDYFKNDLEKLDLIITQNNNDYHLFKDREIDHMVDVKSIIQSTLLFEKVGGILLIIFLIMLFYNQKLKTIEENIRKSDVISDILYCENGFLTILNRLSYQKYNIDHNLLYTEN